jgi:hypothetical protein
MNRVFWSLFVWTGKSVYSYCASRFSLSLSLHSLGSYVMGTDGVWYDKINETPTRKPRQDNQHMLHLMLSIAFPFSAGPENFKIRYDTAKIVKVHAIVRTVHSQSQDSPVRYREGLRAGRRRFDSRQE